VRARVRTRVYAYACVSPYTRRGDSDRVPGSEREREQGGREMKEDDEDFGSRDRARAQRRGEEGKCERGGMGHGDTYSQGE